MLYTILSRFMNRETTAEVPGTPSHEADDVLNNARNGSYTLLV